MPGVLVEISQGLQPRPGEEEEHIEERRWRTWKAESDENGIVVFPDVPNTDAAVWKIHKDGYLVDPKLQRYLGFNEARIKHGLGSSSANPYVWRLWKQQGPCSR